MLTESQAISMQQELRQRVSVTDDLPQPVRIIAGADVKYDKDNDRIARAVVLLDVTTN
jgi:deoxyribonuclease V